MERVEFILTRHSKASYGNVDLEPDGYRGYGLTMEGVELAKARASDLITEYNNMSVNGVMCLSAVSNELRTYGTMKVYSEEITRVIDPNLVFRLEDWERTVGFTNNLNLLNTFLRSRSGDKTVVICPLRFSKLMNYALDKSYIDFLKGQYGEDVNMVIEGWLSQEYKLKETVSPNNSLENYQKVMDKFAKFWNKHMFNRPVIFGLVGHSYDLDALIVGLINQGNINGKTFLDLGGIIKETELLKIDFQNRLLSYRGCNFKI